MNAITANLKAIVAIVVAAVSAWLTGPVLEWTAAASIAVTAAVTGIAVWITRNAPKA
jgi:hypothetical protein